MSKIIDYELDDESTIVNAIRGSRASRLFVEFLQQGGPKPHVVLRLNIDRALKLEGDTWMGCRLAMDLAGGYDGVFHITPLPYNTASHAAHAAFEFELQVNLTVEGIISMTRHLFEFSFAGGFMQPGSKIEYVDGCRDLISQVFIDLHRRGVVGWHVHNIDKGSFNSKNLNVVRGQTGFHQIIGFNYKSTAESTVVENLPLARGTFSSPTFRRTVIYYTSDNHRYQLPYDPATPQSGDEGFDTPTYNPQQTITYPSEWKWSDEHGCWWRLHSNGQYEYSTPSQETSAGEMSTSRDTVGQNSSSNYTEVYVIAVTKDDILECRVDESTKRLRRSGFKWVEGIERYVYVGSSGLEYRLQSLEPEGKGKGKRRA